MTDSLPTVVPLPTERPAGCPFDPPAALAAIRHERPVSRVDLGDGHAGWLVTSHALVRAVLSDLRFSSRHELLTLPNMGEVPPAVPGMFIGMDPPDHTRYRRLLTGKFTVRRMRALTERVEQFTAECLDTMEKQGPPVDLVQVFAKPIPTLMICELLGVPYDEHEMFQRNAVTVNDNNATSEEIAAAMAELGGYIHNLVLAKRAAPTDDLLSDLTTTDLTDEELTGIGGLLLGAGLDTTANMLGLGTFALLSHPDQFAALRADPSLAEQAVEELMRYLSIVHTGMRTALEDVELDGRHIKAGETVVYSVQAANRDPLRYENPDVFDVRRDTSAHLSFGHGVHQCLGQQLARVEMRTAFPALFARFPTLRLAVAPEEVPLRANSDIYGVESLPVTWDQA